VELLFFETSLFTKQMPSYMKVSQSIHQFPGEVIYAPAKIFAGLNWCPHRENLDFVSLYDTEHPD